MLLKLPYFLEKNRAKVAKTSRERGFFALLAAGALVLGPGNAPAQEVKPEESGTAFPAPAISSEEKKPESVAPVEETEKPAPPLVEPDDPQVTKPEHETKPKATPATTEGEAPEPDVTPAIPPPSTVTEATKSSASAKPAKKKPETPDDIHRSFLAKLKAENRYPTAASCAQCHPDHYDEWSVSPHAYAMMSPVFNSMHAFLVDRTSGTTGDFCIRCHTPAGMEQEHDMFGSTLLRPTAVVEGVSCIVCHRVEKDFGNISGRFPIEKGPLSDPVYGPNGNAVLDAAIKGEEFGLVTKKDEVGKLVHQKAHKSPAIERSAQCAMCHDVNSPAGIRLESAFTDYKNSPAAKEGTSCQDCHMGKTPGAMLPDSQRFKGDGHDHNFAWGPSARVKNSSIDSGEGLPTKSKKRTNHMFIGPDYSIVHPGLFPHSVDAMEFTYANRFKKVLTEENKALSDYLQKVKKELTDEEKHRREIATLRKATKEAGYNAKSDWITFNWVDGWGTKAFEEDLSDSARKARLKGVGFPWNDPKDEAGARVRRERARLLLDRQFNLLNKAHAERTRILRRGLQLGEFQVTRNDRKGFEFHVNVHNGTNGHSVPTGFDAERVMFLEATLYDCHGRVLLRSGDRDPNGDIRDLHSAFVHAQAPKEGKWLDMTSWKEPAGLPRTKEDYEWRPDPYLFSLQSKFIVQNLVGGEREQILPLPISFDPLPFTRPSTLAHAHTGRAGPARKKFRSIPALGSRKAQYKLAKHQLTHEGPYTIRFRLIAQMVPVNLIKQISPVGFDYNLSPAEVGRLVAYGHKVSRSGVRKGGAVTVWEKTIKGIVPGSGGGLTKSFLPTNAEIYHIPESEYPFPHISDAELAARRAALSKVAEVKDFVIQNLGPLRPELWPGGVPEGLPMLPPIDLFADEETVQPSLFPDRKPKAIVENVAALEEGLDKVAEGEKKTEADSPPQIIAEPVTGDEELANPPPGAEPAE